MMLNRAILIVLAVGLLAGPHAFPQSFPNRVLAPGENRFKWIAAEEFVSEAGTFRSELLPVEAGHLKRRIEEAFANPAADTPCIPNGVSVEQSLNAIAPRTLGGAIASAQAVIYGNVVGTQGGFGGGIPGTLLTVEVQEWMHRRPNVEQQDVVFVFYPAGEFPIGPARICAHAHNWPPAPAVEDEILLLPQQDTITGPSVLINAGYAGGVEFAYGSAATLRFPERLQNVPTVRNATSLHELRNSVRIVLRERGRR